MAVVPFKTKFDPLEAIASELPTQQEFDELERVYEVRQRFPPLQVAGSNPILRTVPPPKRRDRSWLKTAAIVAATLAGAALLAGAPQVVRSAYAQGSPSAAPKAYKDAVMGTTYKGLEKSGLIQKSGTGSLLERRLRESNIMGFINQEYARCPNVGKAGSKKGIESLTAEAIKSNSTIDLTGSSLWVFDKDKKPLDVAAGNEGRSFEVPTDGSVVIFGPLCTQNSQLPVEVAIKGIFSPDYLKCDESDFTTGFYISNADLKRAMKCGLQVGERVKFVLRAPIATYKVEGGKKVPSMIYVESDQSIPFTLISPDEVEQARRDAEFRERVKHDLTPSVPGSGLPYARPTPTTAPAPSSGTSKEVVSSRSLAELGVPPELEKGCTSCSHEAKRSMDEAYSAPEDHQETVRRRASYDVEEGEPRWSGAIGPAFGKGNATFQPRGGVDPTLSGWMLGVYADLDYASSTSMAGVNLLYLSSGVTDETSGTHLNATYKTVDLSGFGVKEVGPVSIGARGAVSSETFDNRSTAGFSRGISTLEGVVGKQFGDKLFVGGMAGFGKVKDDTQPSIPDLNNVHTYGFMGHADFGGRIVATGAYEKIGGAISGTDVDIAGSHLALDVRARLFSITDHLGIGVAGGLSKTSLTFDSVHVPTAPFKSDRKYVSAVLTFR